METPDEYIFTRYLAAKKSVDDRALNLHVWHMLKHELSQASQVPLLRVLEIGTGIGTMIERALDWGLLTRAEYTALDSQAENIAYASQRLREFAIQQGYLIELPAEGLLTLARGDCRMHVNLVARDLFDFISAHQAKQQWDLIIAHAFLDLVDIPSTLPMLFWLAKPNALIYCTLNFDGVTILEPVVDPPFDDLVIQLYHQTMDKRLIQGKPSGDSQAGRHLYHLFKASGGEVLGAGASDWVVFPREGGYARDEAYFLHFIVHTIQQALQGHPELDTERFSRWIVKRHEQISHHELVYIAHQLDLLGRVNIHGRS